MATTSAAAAAAAEAAAALPLPLFPRTHLRSRSITRLSPFSSISRRTISPCEYRRRDSNAGADEFGQNRRRIRRRRWWWKDTSPPSEMGDGIVEEVLDSIFIFKVFRLYGWWLAPIMISMLLATGPKAFVLALAVMIVLSVLTLAFMKLWGSVDGPKRRFRAKKKARGRTTGNINIDEEEEEVSRMGYRSWVSYDDGNSKKGDGDFSDYKGWDELDGASLFNEKTTRRSPRVGQSRREEKSVQRESGGEMPLLLRLLIAVFPFLGSWTRML